jgi:hypothetical protein
MRASGKRPLLAAPAGFALLCLAVAGCGGGSVAASSDTSARAASTPQRSAGSVAPVDRSAALAAKLKYERAMQTLGGQLESSLRLAGDIEVASGGRQSAAAKDAKALEQARIALRRAAAKLERIVPPPSLRPAQGLLITGVSKYADELGRVIAQLEAGGAPVVVLQNILRFQGIKDMERASIQIEKKGYSIVAG